MSQFDAAAERVFAMIPCAGGACESGNACSSHQAVHDLITATRDDERQTVIDELDMPWEVR